MNNIFDYNICIWERLARETRPIFLYGTGNGADKILYACERYGIKITGVFASDGFVRSRSFKDMPVQSYKDIVNEYGYDIVALLCFGTVLDTVKENIEKINREITLYIPEVPLYSSELFDTKYLNENIGRIVDAYNILEDEKSKKIFTDMIEFRLSGEYEKLSDTVKPQEMYKELIGSADYVIDCGAYKGDSAEDIRLSLEPKEIIAIEPDAKTFKKLSAYAKNTVDCSIIPLNYAVGKEPKTVIFNSSGSRGSGKEGASHRGKQASVNYTSIDSLQINGVNLIKYDVEGDEKEAILGSVETIKKFRPALSVSVYHRTEDLFEIPLLINELFNGYKFYIRRAPCIPAWDISLIAIPD